MSERNVSFDRFNSCKQLLSVIYMSYMKKHGEKLVTWASGWFPAVYHVLDETKSQFVSPIEFIRYKVSNFSANVSGIIGRPWPAGSVALCK